MTLLVCAILLLALLAAWRYDAKTIAAEREDWRAERQSLLDRIQHPEVRQVTPGPSVEYEPPTDTAELAYVGQEVPEFVNVGTSDG